MTRILLATDDHSLEQRIREAFEPNLNGDLRRCALGEMPAGVDGDLEALLGLPGGPCQGLILGPDLPPRTALALANRIDRERPDVSVLLVAPRSTRVLEQALRAGIRDVIPPDATGPDLRQTVEHALDVAARRRSHLATLPPPPPAGPSGQVIVVASPKGGSGKTTVGANLAVTLAQNDPGSTVLVDLDLQFGDVASALQLLPESTWADVMKAGELDVTSLKVFLTRHSSGLFVLCSPELPADGENVSFETVGRVLNLLAGEFRTVVVDTGAGLDEHTLAALEAATDVVLVCSTDVPSVRSLRKEIVTLDQLGLVAQQRHFVLNRADARVGLEVADVEATIGMVVDVALPSSRCVPLAMNQGIPVVESEPRSAVSRQLAKLAERFAPVAADRSSGFLRRRKDRA